MSGNTMFKLDLLCLNLFHIIFTTPVDLTPWQDSGRWSFLPPAWNPEQGQHISSISFCNTATLVLQGEHIGTPSKMRDLDFLKVKEIEDSDLCGVSRCPPKKRQVFCKAASTPLVHFYWTGEVRQFQWCLQPLGLWWSSESWSKGAKVDATLVSWAWEFRSKKVVKQMDVSKNRGTPKWMVYNGKPH